jgi:hypothetical protein
VWREEALAIPPHIEKGVASLLLVANEELLITLDLTNHFDSSAFENIMARNEFFESRSRRCSEFGRRMNDLQTTIRKYLKSVSDTEGYSTIQ